VNELPRRRVQLASGSRLDTKDPPARAAPRARENGTRRGGSCGSTRRFVPFCGSQLNLKKLPRWLRGKSRRSADCGVGTQMVVAMGPRPRKRFHDGSLESMASVALALAPSSGSRERSVALLVGSNSMAIVTFWLLYPDHVSRGMIFTVAARARALIMGSR
jgi:hypothetical protein